LGPSNPRPQGFLGAHKVLNRLWYLIVSESKRNRRMKSKGTTTRHTKSAGRTVPETRTTRVPRRRVTPLAETDDSRLRAGGARTFLGLAQNRTKSLRPRPNYSSSSCAKHVFLRELRCDKGRNQFRLPSLLLEGGSLLRGRNRPGGLHLLRYSPWEHRDPLSAQDHGRLS